MPPIQSIVGGDVFPVRGDHVWTTTSSPSSSISSVDTNALLSAISSSSASSESSDFSSSEGESSEEDDEVRPPSPPVKTIILGAPTLGKASSPTSSIDSEDGYFAAASTASSKSGNKTFLNRVFPRSKIIDRAVPISTNVANCQLAIFEESTALDVPRTLYARGAAGFEAMNLRENLVELLDHADEVLDCDSVVVILDKKDPSLASILHSLMYVGGVVVQPSATSIHNKHSSKVILVGIDL